jgi:hypothetical protein
MGLRMCAAHDSSDAGTPDAQRTGIAAVLDSTSAMVRAESDHLDATLHALVNRLSSVPALSMQVSHRHGRLRRLIGDLPYINDLHRRTDPIEKIVVNVGGCVYWLHTQGGSMSCGKDSGTFERPSGSEQLSFSDWAAALFDDIAHQNLVNHDSLLALRQLVEQDRVGETHLKEE